MAVNSIQDEMLHLSPINDVTFQLNKTKQEQHFPITTERNLAHRMQKKFLSLYSHLSVKKKKK